LAQAADAGTSLHWRILEPNPPDDGVNSLRLAR